jgi:hypothetical protein
MSNNFRLAGIALAMSLSGSQFLVGSAHASILLSYPSFAGACGTSLTCVGNTAESGSALQLTQATTSQSGAGYSTTPLTLGTGATFSSTFQFQFTNTGGIAPADGITFVLAQNSTGLGGVGGGLGYFGVPNSVAIEFDTFANGGNDPDSNHVAIDTNGSLTNTALANPYGVSNCSTVGGTTFGCMSNGDIWTAIIGFDGSKLSVSVKDGSGATQNLITDYPIDIASILGTTTAFVGFTGATGSGYENQKILNWQIADDTSLAPPTVPEPASIALLGIGLLGLGASRRKR